MCRCKYTFYAKNGNAVFNYFDSKSNAGYLACQQLVDIFNEIPYYVKNEHIEAFYINEDRCQIINFIGKVKLKKHS